MTDKHKAIKLLKADAKFILIGNDLTWLDGNPTNITESDIEAKMNELQSDYDTEDWKRNRQAEYPNLRDCIHALLDGGDTLTDLQEKRQAVKTKYPKP